MKRAEVYQLIDGEIEYGEQLWEALPRSERPLRDAEKPVEFWVMHIERYTDTARGGCYGTDKTPALEAIRKIAALCVRCMENNPTPGRVYANDSTR